MLRQVVIPHRLREEPGMPINNIVGERKLGMGRGVGEEGGGTRTREDASVECGVESQ